MSLSRNIVLVALVILGVASRWLPHPPNVSPVMAIALLSGVYFSGKKGAVLLPLVALFISDLVLGFHSTIWAVYLAMAVVVWGAGQLSSKSQSSPGWLNVTLMGLGASVWFFLLTNFAVWAQTGMYPHTVDGLVACYVAAIPFFQNSLMGNAVYIFILFGSYELIRRHLPQAATAR
ncbi:MAG: hypothetical protein KDD61_15845 [Bdellovibrionales bacterium]|nr:hypothetical protein [Bdellovibrionales bacterium]